MWLSADNLGAIFQMKVIFMKYVRRFLHMLRYVCGSGKAIVLLAVLIKVLSGLLPAGYIAVYTKLIDGILTHLGNNQFWGMVFRLLPVFISIGFLNYFISSLTNYLTLRLQTALVKVLRKYEIKKISRLSYYHIENAETYELLNRVRKNTPNGFITGFFAYLSLMELILRICSIALSVYRMEPWLSALLLLLFIPMALVSIRSGQQDYAGVKDFMEVQRRLEDYQNVLTSKEYLNERVLFGYQDWYISKWENQFSRAVKMLMSIRKRSYIGVKMSSAIITICGLLMMLSLMFGVRDGTVTVGGFSAVSSEILALTSGLSWAFCSAIQTIVRCQELMADVEQFEAISELESDKQNILVKHVKKVEFRNVRFRYPGTEKVVLDNFNLKIDTNRRYALVGKNGQGKTTLSKLLLGLYPQYEGEILLDGQELRSIKNAAHAFSVAFQDFAKYQVSLRNNITFGDPNRMEDAEIERHLFGLGFPLIKSRFPHGLDTSIGYLSKEGNDLSLGQWQKIILVRAIAEDGFFYILDEPTASLDPSTEQDVYENFLSALAGRSSLIITHRLGAARLADEIIVIDSGCVAEQGTHEQLVEASGIYAELYEKQREWYQ